MRDIREVIDIKELKQFIMENWRRLLSYLAVALVIFSVSALVSYNFLIDRFTLEMPDLVGRDLAEVDEILREMALSVNVVDEEFDREVPAGQVSSQSIDRGSVVRGQTVVDVVLSKGPEVRLIPDLTSIEIGRARETIRENNLVLDKVIMVHSRRASEDMVIAQSPLPDEWTGEAITLVVSDGPHDVIYYNPFFVGMAKMDALMLARDLGLSVRISELDNTNTISYQSPVPGAEIKKGDVLILRVGG